MVVVTDYGGAGGILMELAAVQEDITMPIRLSQNREFLKL
jgi:hypothetical protein